MRKERGFVKAKSLKREERFLKRIFILCIVTVFIIFAACGLFGNLMTSAHGNFSEEPVSIVRYKSIRIEQGDTLWNIAEAYMTEGTSVSQFVAELKRVNALKGDRIDADHNLVIPY